MPNRIDAREKALWERLSSYSKDVHDFLPIKVSELRRILEELKEPAIISTLQKELVENLDQLDDELQYAALLFTWSRGSSSPDLFTCGTAAETCELPSYGYSDQVDLGKDLALERDQPDLDGEADELQGFGIGPVMGPWHEKVAPLLSNADYSKILNTPVHGPFNEAKDIYEELFRLRLFQLIGKAYARIDRDKPRYLFVGTTDRWPVLVYEAP